MNNDCSCVIPFYNEGKRLLRVLQTVVKVKNIKEIICVDAGSEINIHNKVKRLFPYVKYLRTSGNSGKTKAMFKGVSLTSSKYILFLDADLRKLNRKELETAISIVKKNQSIDMLILRRMNGRLEPTWFRADTIFSGERIVKKKDFLEVIRTLKPSGYQIEIALNKFIMENRKKVFWFPSSALNTMKRVKVGFVQGLINEIKMHYSMIQFAGLFNYFYQTISFCKQPVKSSSV